MRIVPTVDYDAALEKKLIDLVIRAFPDDASVHGRWYYDTRPSFVIVEEAGDDVIGMRMVIERTITTDARAVRIAGIGVAVDPAHQKKGVGTALTKRALEELVARGFDLAVAFLSTKNAELLLRHAGFRELKAKVTYLDARSDQLVEEHTRCFLKALRDAALVDEIEARGELHIGSGTW